MGDRRSIEVKKKQKVGSSRSNYPEDIPEGCKKKLSWRNVNGKSMLRKVEDQGNKPYCWNIASSRMLSSHLYIHDENVHSLLPLSARHLFVGVKEKNPDGSLKNYEALKDFLVNEGMIQEEECKCVIAEENEESGSSKSKKKKMSSKLEKAKADPCFGKPKVYNIYSHFSGEKDFQNKKYANRKGQYIDEKELIKVLQKGPVAVTISIANEFKLFKGDGVYMGYGTDNCKSLEDHMILLTGYDTTSDGINYFEFQNSHGLQWGENGFGKLVRQSSRKDSEPSLIIAYIYPEL